MEPYSKTENYSLYLGNMLDVLDTLDENSIDSIITDPPYGLTSITKRFGKDGSFARLSRGFMGKEWDGSGVEYNIKTWEKCLRVLKPGGYLLAFGGSRTFHRIACAIEDAGFEIRDTIMWLYGSGFPKSMNIGKKNKLNEWEGWGTALKPSFEPIIVVRKPFKGSCVDNVLKYGVGGINIDECRIGVGTGKEKPDYKPNNKNNVYGNGFGGGKYENVNGRFPANIILTYDDSDFDEVCGGFPNTSKSKGGNSGHLDTGTVYGKYNQQKNNSGCGYGDSGSASRYFYCAKASKKDRDEGLDEFDKDIADDGRNKPIDNPFLRGKTLRHNIHPTVKPTSLMQYLVRLVSPKGATILDPFMGSGSTGKAVMYENKEREARYKFIGIEMTEEYLPIAEARIKYANNA